MSRAPAVRVSLSWPALFGVLLTLLVGGGVAVWQLQVQSLDGQIEIKRKALKNLHLGGRLPPNQHVMDYLTARTKALEAQYQDALDVMGTLPSTLEANADPQLFFQQRVHEVQNTLNRLTTARGLEVPGLLGLPKDLPPPDVAPRFLLQLQLVQELAELVLSVHEVSALESFKVEDPQPIDTGIAGRPSFLTRLPVRIRFSSTLRGVTSVLGVIDHAKPVIDVASLRMVVPETDSSASPPAAKTPAAASSTTASDSTNQSPAPGQPESKPEPAVLNVEAVLVRYLITSPQVSMDEAEPDKSVRRKKP